MRGPILIADSFFLLASTAYLGNGYLFIQIEGIGFSFVSIRSTCTIRSIRSLCFLAHGHTG